MHLEQKNANSWEGLLVNSSQEKEAASVRPVRAAGKNGSARAPAAPVSEPRDTGGEHDAIQRILIVTRPGLFADGFARSLRTLGPRVEVRTTGMHAAHDAARDCALVLLDLEEVGDCRQAIAGLRHRTQAPVVVLAPAWNNALVITAMAAGAVALIAKTFGEAQILELIDGLLKNTPAPAQVKAATGADARDKPIAPPRVTHPYGLTAGEMDVLRLLAEGLTNAQIARERGSKEGTVKIHLDKIYKKLNVQSRTQAICIASRMDSMRDLQLQRLQQVEFRFESLIPYVTHEIHGAGEVLFSRGDPGDALYYVQKGRVKLVELELEMEEGGLFGEIGIFSPGHERTCTARCETQTSLFRLSADQAQRLYIENPRFAYHVVRLVAGRLIADQARAAARI